MKISRVSPSRLEVFDNCPFHYRLKYHDEIPETGEMPAAQFGSWIHKGLELHVKDGVSIQEALKSCVNDYSFGNDLLSFLPSILRNFQKVNEGLEKGKTEFEFKLDAGFGVPVNGVIDRLIPRGDRYLILDYKTGRFQKTKSQLKTNYQLLIYAWAAHTLTETPYEKLDLALAYLRSGDLITVSFKAFEVETFLGVLAQKVKTIQEMEPEGAKPKPGGACNLCSYTDKCKACQAYKKLRAR